jgi:hypothetical protein
VTRADPTGGNQTIATMSRRKVLGGVAGVTAAVLLAMYLWPMHRPCRLAAPQWWALPRLNGKEHSERVDYH